jgi:hypothetical protein
MPSLISVGVVPLTVTDTKTHIFVILLPAIRPMPDALRVWLVIPRALGITIAGKLSAMRPSPVSIAFSPELTPPPALDGGLSGLT